MESQGTYINYFEALPDEILTQILSYFSHSENIAECCQLVCRKWYNIIVDLWRMKSLRIYPKIEKLKEYTPTTKILWRKIATHNPFDKNLLKNHTGQTGNFEHWLITENGGNRWRTEIPPFGVSNEDGDSDLKIRSCFASSYRLCAKSQIVELLNEGFSAQILDMLQPEIIVSEYYARRSDCPSKYALRVELLTADKMIVDYFEFEHSLNIENGWKKVTHTFCNYGPNVRFINFMHSGKDLWFWRGHYGSKMTEASVQFSLKSIYEPTISNLNPS